MGRPPPRNSPLKMFGGSVPGRPIAMSASPDNGPKAKRYVCVPSPIVAKPSPPEICWHLIAPLTLEVGVRYPLGPAAKTVGPVYDGSELLTPAFAPSG